jgi:protein gp37
MGEIGGPWVPEEWIESVIQVVRECPQHDFMFLTKYPENFLDRKWPDNAWVGATVTNQQDAMDRLPEVRQIRAKVKYISCEPLHGPVYEQLDGLQWVIVGAQTKPDLQPEWWWVKAIMGHAQLANAKVFLKNNLTLPEGQSRTQEWPS